MPIANNNGVELYWERRGAGPSLILGAGLGGVGGWWDPNRNVLAEQFTVYTFDQRGTGRSSRVPVSSIEQMSADLITIMDAANIDKAHYLGHSTGAAIGVATALDHEPRLRSLMIYASTTWGDAYRRRLLTLRQQIFDRLGVDGYVQYTSLLLYPPYWINANHERLAAEEKRTASQLGPPDVQASRLTAILNFDRRAALTKIRIPTIVVCADDDILTPRYFSEEYAQLIPSARARYIPRGGHALSRTEPDIFNRIALEFFTEADSA
jgi:aminoacrylate hydrolase